MAISKYMQSITDIIARSHKVEDVSTDSRIELVTH